MNEQQLEAILQATQTPHFSVLALADFLCKQGVIDRDALITHLQNSGFANGAHPAAQAACKVLVSGLMQTDPDLPPA